jgi:Tol biopolymer transport system component
MMLVRVITAAVKPALLGAAISAAAGGAYLAYDRFAPHADVSAFQSVQGHGQKLLISEFGDTTDTIVAVDPDDVGARTTIATIDHASGYGVFPVLSPDGQAIAYTGLPAGIPKPAPDAPAQAGVVDVRGKATLLAADADLLVSPVWSPDSQSIVVRHSVTAADGSGTYELLLLGRDGARASLTTWRTASLFPIAFAPDGARLYFATLSPAGTDLYAIGADGSGETKIAHLSDEIARDWKLSPDGATLAYSVAEGGPQPQVVTMTLALATGVAADAVRSPAAARLEFNPAWQADGTLTIASVQPQGGSAVSVVAAATARTLTSNDGAIDLPLAWSPDGARLAVRSVEGASLQQATASHVEIVGGDGSRRRVSDSADVLIVGWLP